MRQEDAFATAALLIREPKTASAVGQLLELPCRPMLLYGVPFGKHRDQIWCDEPPGHPDRAALRN